MKNIWVTGNGFDLYHGLKTEYKDFISCVEEAFSRGREARNASDVRYTELCNVNGFFRHFHFNDGGDGSWTYFEEEMRAIVDCLANFSEVVETAQRDPEYDLTAYQIINGLFTYRDMKIFRDFARIFEQVFDDPSGGMFKIRTAYITPDKTLDMKALVAEVRRELDDFTAALDMYLKENVMGVDNGIRLPDMEAPDYVINMNFTDTARLYGVPESHIHYTRGRAGSDPVNLVLGSPDESEEHPDWISLKTYFRRLERFIGLPDWHQSYSGNGQGLFEPVTFAFLGYSFPAFDSEALKGLDLPMAQFVVTYTDGSDYAAKVLALMKIFGKTWVTNNTGSEILSFKEI
ncbi:MAG: bacteriophage abortive infection AbiH family protein [Clostridiales bacterium]|nr:bacteriophage abortive infection AbiH family protein [Clostridiales bacterium]